MRILGYRTFAAGILLGLAAAVNAAEPAPAAQRIAFNIDAPSMVRALIQFTEQSGLQLAFPSDGAAEMPAPRVVGNLTPREALERLLKDSGLQYEFTNDRTVSVRAPASTSAAPGAAGQARPVSDSALRLAQAEQGAASTGESAEERQPGSKGVPEILVKGRRSLNMDIQRGKDDVQPYVVFDKETIQKSGASTLEDFLLNRLTSMSNSGASAQFAGSTGSNRSVLNLRALGSAQTLILIDGRRAAPVSSAGVAGQSDLNGVPLSAIERVEVLPSTASGIYGGGATGGVINVILRRDYRGVETTLAYDNAFDGARASRRVDIAGGMDFRGGKTSLLLIGSYSEADQLSVGDRDFLRRGRAATLANTPEAILDGIQPPLGATTNICSGSISFGFAFCNGSPLSLNSGQALGSSITSVPYGYTGPGTDNGVALLSNAGEYNLDLANTAQQYGARQALLNGPTISSLAATLRNEFTDRLQGFVEVSKSKNAGYADGSGVISTYFIPQGVPNNPFAQDIVVTTPLLGADSLQASTIENLRALGGLILQLPGDWRAEADYTWGRSRYYDSQLRVALDPSADAAISAGGINLLRDTNINSLDFSQYLAGAPSVSPSDVKLNDVVLRAAGPLGLKLPGGSPTLSLAVEHRREDISAFTTNYPYGGVTYLFVFNSRSQTIDSAYAELNVPLISAQNALPAIESLELTIAGRRDDYQMTGSEQTNGDDSTPPPPGASSRTDFASDDYTFGVRYQPLKDITLRASAGTGFLPPALNQLVPAATLPSANFFGYTDPQRGDELLPTYNVMTGGNPDLKPERSRSRSAGIILQPRFAPGLRMSADWTKIEKRDNTYQIALTQFVLDHEDEYPGLIIRGAPSGGYPVGPVVTVNGRPINLARQDVEAIDFAADYRFTAGRWGDFSLSAAATRNLDNVFQIAPSTPGIQSLGTQGFTKWAANAQVSWDYGSWNLRWATRYFDSYWLQTGHQVLPAQGAAAVPEQIYHDASATYVLPESGRLSFLSRAHVQLGIRNVFDKHPPMDLTSTGQYSYNGDPRLATYFLSLKLEL